MYDGKQPSSKAQQLKMIAINKYTQDLRRWLICVSLGCFFCLFHFSLLCLCWIFSTVRLHDSISEEGFHYLVFDLWVTDLLWQTLCQLCSSATFVGIFLYFSWGIVLPETKCISRIKRLDNAAGHSITYFLSKSSEILSLGLTVFPVTRWTVPSQERKLWRGVLFAGCYSRVAALTSLTAKRNLSWKLWRVATPSSASITRAATIWK